MFTSCKAPGEFPPEVIDVLKTFATQSALAIQNARLFREIADKSAQLENPRPLPAVGAGVGRARVGTRRHGFSLLTLGENTESAAEVLHWRGLGTTHWMADPVGSSD